MKTYVVYFRNGGMCEITCEDFFRSPTEGHLRFTVGNRNIAIFETDAIVGFFEKQEGGGEDG